MKRFGLIGKKLSHSFSPPYFNQKFQNLGLTDYRYDSFELNSIDEINEVFAIKELVGLNVTIPYKTAVIDFLDDLDQSASAVGAVNVIKIEGSKRIGYNTDVTGFSESLHRWLPSSQANYKALIFGSGGASMAVRSALHTLNISYKIVSRTPNRGELSYIGANEYLDTHLLLINTTPLGMYPHVNQAPHIDYSKIGNQHYLYDLIYNPEKTLFLQHGESRGAQIKNGLDMLHIQAEESFTIWTKD